MAKCPICKKQDITKKYSPFCSSRCADIDLHRWLGEQYTVPAYEPPDEWDMDAAMENNEDADGFRLDPSQLN